MIHTYFTVPTLPLQLPPLVHVPHVSGDAVTLGGKSGVTLPFQVGILIPNTTSSGKVIRGCQQTPSVVEYDGASLVREQRADAAREVTILEL